MASNLTTQVREIASVTTAVANGDLSQKISEEAKEGEVLELSTTINRMVDALNIFADEVTNVAREVGTEGILGGQAEVPNVAGAWKALTDNVNTMASNLTSQVREIASVSTALARGDFSKKIEVHVRGEVQELKNNINAMVDSFITIVRAANSIAEGDFALEMPLRSDADQLSIALNSMTRNLKRISEENENEAWIKNGQANLNDKMRGELDINALSKNIITYLTKYLKAQIGALYLAEAGKDGEVLKLVSTYAYTKRKTAVNEFKMGESLVGQAALEREAIVVTSVPQDYVVISSSIGESQPRNLLVQPCMIGNEVKGIIEIGSFHDFTDNQLELVRVVAENIAISINSAQDRAKMELLLQESQRKSEELLDQQQKLRNQSEELQVANEDLEIKTRDLERQKEDIQTSRIEVEQKAQELELASKYKSEFLANMSHELRTPLNSLLILAKELTKNEKGNLDNEQIKDARIIYDGGNDLLNLINDILDLSKVEAGKLQVHPQTIGVKTLLTGLENKFNPIAKDKGIAFSIDIAENVPKNLYTDDQRLQQILKNLLSNAFKFTEKGEVVLSAERVEDSVRFRNIAIDRDNVVAFSVADTGIGINKEKFTQIFEAFQQAEGGTSRQYGGTGLGLTISRELSRLLGGEIHIWSEPGEGSKFTVFVPIDLSKAELFSEDKDGSSIIEYSQYQLADKDFAKPASSDKTEPTRPFVADDRNDISPKDSSLLIIEDDQNFAEILKREVKSQNYNVLVAREGREGLELAAQFQPKGIFLDIRLPDLDGIRVLDQLKFNLKTRHIPVHIISVEDKSTQAMSKGAIGFLSKPASLSNINDVIKKITDIQSSQVKQLLLVEDNQASIDSLKRILSNSQIEIVTAQSGAEAEKVLKKSRPDCIILDLNLPDTSGFDLLTRLNSKGVISDVPIIIYTGQELTKDEVRELRKYTDSIVIKGVSSPERLLDEVSLFIHSVESQYSDQQREILTKLHDPEKLLSGQKVLLVDDDVRNTYALSKVLADAEMQVVLADNGMMALEKIKQEPDISIILMDVMMPVMDGYEATRKIRQLREHKDLPIIALTAKAMAEDRSKCLDAGANDYLTKPVDVEKLLNIMRVWLYK